MAEQPFDGIVPIYTGKVTFYASEQPVRLGQVTEAIKMNSLLLDASGQAHGKTLILTSTHGDKNGETFVEQVMKANTVADTDWTENAGYDERFFLYNVRTLDQLRYEFHHHSQEFDVFDMSKCCFDEGNLTMCFTIEDVLKKLVQVIEDGKYGTVFAGWCYAAKSELLQQLAEELKCQKFKMP